MRYDYFNFIKDNATNLKDHPLFDQVLNSLFESNIYCIISDLDIDNKFIRLKTEDEENNRRTIDIFDDVVEISGTVSLNDENDLDVSEIIYKKDDTLYYSYSELYEGPDGVVITATTAALNKHNLNNNVIVDDIKTGIWAYDIATYIKHIVDMNKINYLSGGTWDNNNFDYYDNMIQIQNVFSKKYILPDEFMTAEIKLEDDKYRVKSNINGKDAGSYKCDLDIGFKQTLRSLDKTLHYDHSIIYKALNIAGLTKDILPLNYFDAIDFTAFKEEIVKQMKEEKPKQMVKINNCITAEAD